MRNLLVWLLIPAAVVVYVGITRFLTRLPPWWMGLVLVALVIVNGLLWLLLTRLKPRDQLAHERLLNGQCPQCGYDLTGNVSGVCPECGLRW